MKVRRALGGTLFGLGCAAVFIGLLATVLPMIQNDQLKLVLQTFETPSQNAVVEAMNAGMRYAMANSYGVMGLGVGLMLAGAGLLLWNGQADAQPRRADQWHAYRPAAPRRPAQPTDAPREDDAAPAPKANPFADVSMEELFAPRAAAQKTAAIGVFESILPKQTADAASLYARPAAADPAPVASVAPIAPTPVAYAPPTPVTSMPPVVEQQPASAAPVAPTTPAALQAPQLAPQAPVARPVPELPKAEVGAPSQSGARVIVRSTVPQPKPEPQPAPALVPEAPARITPATFVDESGYTPNEPEPEAPKQVSPRIKSTMGKHTV